MRYPTNSKTGEYLDRFAANDNVKLGGTGKKPYAPRNLQAQPGNAKILVTWDLPPVNTDITGWIIYKDNESSKAISISDPKTRQASIPAGAGATPPATNIFISSINAQGVESQKVQVISSAKVDATAPTDPAPPAGSAAGGSTGIDPATLPPDDSGGRFGL